MRCVSFSLSGIHSLTVLANSRLFFPCSIYLSLVSAQMVCVALTPTPPFQEWSHDSGLTNQVIQALWPQGCFSSEHTDLFR